MLKYITAGVLLLLFIPGISLFTNHFLTSKNMRSQIIARYDQPADQQQA